MTPEGTPDDEPRPSRSTQTKVTLSYPQHIFEPEDVLDFIQLPQFTKRWEKLGLDDDADFTALRLAIMANPRGGDIIPGTGGIRKLRFAPARWNCGKSGAARVLYAYLEDYGAILLCVVFSKSETDNISPAVRQFLKKLVSAQLQELKRRGTI